jgi:hypothetical protein
VVIVAVLVLVALIALLWLVAMRWLRDDGVPVRASLDADGSIRAWSAEQEREQVSHPAPGGGLDRAKDRNVAQTWGPGL